MAWEEGLGWEDDMGGWQRLERAFLTECDEYDDYANALARINRVGKHEYREHD